VVTPRERIAVSLSLGLLTPLALVFSLAGPVHATVGPTFAQSVKTAIHSVSPSYSLKASRNLAPVSELDPAQKATVDTAVFAAGNKILGVQRVVGASRQVSRATVPGNARVLSSASVRRAGAGARSVIITSTADEWGPGLTVASWTERSGVNYQVVARGAVGTADLLKIAQALPRDSSTVGGTTLSQIAKAPPATGNVDGVVKGSQTSGTTQRSSTNYTVDGSGTVTDDWANESTLCSGCAYSNGNYTGMWQLVLYADKKLAWSGIDCSFGSGTASATRSWQSSEGLGVDGIVGANSRGRADNYLGGNYYVTYWGSYDFVDFTRNTTSSYYYYYGGTRLSYSFAPGAISPC
jgi:peptidoglycan hydrolase-like protein with peptidoglycan-binding domain